MLIRILIAVHQRGLGARIEGLLAGRGIVVTSIPEGRHVLERRTRTDFDLLIVEHARLPDPSAGLLRSIRRMPEQPEVVVLTHREDPTERAALLAAGCLAVLHVGLDDADLRSTLQALVERRRQDATRRLESHRAGLEPSLADFVSDSTAMQVFLTLVRRVVPADTSLLILGETGVGKEHLARAIHAEGRRAAGPFLAVNCAALPESLLESELFGHEEGAFTGATRPRRGYFELAHGGTLLLDEVGEIPLHLQAKLLRILDERRVLRVGGEKPFPIDVRVMAATNRDLEREVREGRFRADLFYRLAVVTLEVPALRERREDIPQLVRGSMDRFGVQTGRPVSRIAEGAMELLRAHDWPGNVRELANTVERAVLLCTGDEITAGDLPLRVQRSTSQESDPGPGSVRTAMEQLPESLWDRPLVDVRAEIVSTFEVCYLTRLMRGTSGRVGEAASRASVHERSLYDMLKRHGIRKEDFKHHRNARPAPEDRRP